VTEHGAHLPKVVVLLQELHRHAVPQVMGLELG
jgi:hypothetical protein